MSDMERRSTDRRVAERETMRANPEVMGRTEPRTVDEPRNMESPQPTVTTNARTEGWPEMNEIRLRFDQLQAEFIDDPKAAVKKAEKLMEEAMDKMARAMRERIQTVRRDTEGNNTDTERLRMAMRSFREMIESMAPRRTA